MNPPDTLYTAAQVREADKRANARADISGFTLMQHAGAAAFALLRSRWPRASSIGVVCGPGNNGGDGYVLAALAADAGLRPHVIALHGSQTASADTRAARARAAEAGVAVRDGANMRLRECDVIVDALFGTGLEREVEGVWRAAIDAINAADRPVLAIDLPSGLHADTGRLLGAAVRANATISFIGLKAGTYTGCGREYCGEIVFDDLAVPPEVFAGITPIARRITRDSLRGLLAPRARHVHKGMVGRVLLVGGGPGMPGALRLAGQAAYRAGAGLVGLATHETHAALIAAACPELIAHAITSAGDLRGRIAHAAVCGVGPGLGQDRWARMLWAALHDSALPLVVDADGLNLLAHDPVSRPDWVLTPHPGEAARLLGCRVADIQHDRFAAARALAARYGGVCVLKGSGTIVADGSDGPLWLCDRGNPGMASAGTGDVLTGTIAALLAQGLATKDAARLGVWVHASAGDAAARAHGEIGLMASDLLAPIRDYVNRVACA